MRKSVISKLNSTETPLGKGDTFTGTKEMASFYTAIGVSVISSHQSNMNGLQIQFSPDTNWDIIHSYTIPSNEGKYFVVPVESQYFRIIYKNGSIPQTYFRLQTILYTVPQQLPLIRLSDTIDSNTQAQATKSLVVGQTESGDLDSIKVDNDSYLGVTTKSLEEMFSEVLKELRIMNIHLATLTDNYITKQEVE